MAGEVPIGSRDFFRSHEVDGVRMRSGVASQGLDPVELGGRRSPRLSGDLGV